MDLWNEYEGRSIDGLFPLERLIRPEGRSAFFSTSSGGIATVIRLIESHFDEDEILARWTGVSDLHQPNLLTMTRFGQAMMDETSLVYVVLEPTEADLSQILCERPLTVAETRQVADSLIPALQALHEKGFIHEHIQAANVLAVGEMVKLRSDCIREAPEGEEGNALRTRDVSDFATLLLQCLTLQRNHAISPTGPPLPAPFREIIHNGISGAWTFARMGAALEASVPKPIKVSESLPSSSPSSSLSSSPSGEPAKSSRSGSRVTSPSLASAAASVATNSVERTVPTRTGIARDPLPHRTSGTAAARHVPEPVRDRIRVPMRQKSESLPRRIVLLAIAIAGILIVGPYALFHHSDSKTVATDPVSSPVTAQTASGQTSALQASPNPAPAPARLREEPASSIARNQWRVVAFTYNRQAEASAKARVLEQRFASLHPSVFTPTGHAPYLVTLGGSLTREAAFRLKNKLHGEGLPRDIYAQNYTSKSL